MFAERRAEEERRHFEKAQGSRRRKKR